MRSNLLNGRSLAFLLLSLIFIPKVSFANCEMSKDPNIALFVSPEAQSWGSFSPRTAITSSMVGKCYEDADKQLMITLSVVHPGTRSNIRHSYFFNNYSPESCNFQNSEVIKTADASMRADFFSQQFKLLRSCFEVRVVDPSGQPLTVKDKQQFCTTKRNDDGSVTLNGDLCFIKIKPRNQFQITPVLKEECKTPEGLARLGVPAQDLMAGLDVFVAGDDSGNSEDLTQIGTRDIRLNLVPSAKAIPLSDDNGPDLPRFSSQYNVDVDWGGLTLQKQGDQMGLNATLFASNISKESCRGSACARGSNFVQPVFGQFQLFELPRSGKKILIDEWWDGGFAFPNWQGLIPGMMKTIDGESFVPHKKYRLQVSFQDPTDDYAIFLTGLSQMLINIDGVVNGVVGLSQIPSLGNLQTLGVLPYYSGMSGLGAGELQVRLDDIINGLSAVVKNNVWPGYYDYVCALGKPQCARLGKTGFYQTLTLDFVLGDLDESTGQMKIENISTQKQSTAFGGYPMAARSLPTISCDGGE